MKPKPIVNSNHYLALVVSGVIFACSILAFMFVYYRVGIQIENTNSAYADMIQAQQRQSQAASIVQTLSDTQSQRDTLTSFFVPDSQTVSFITQVEAAGKESSGSKVSIASISDDDLSASPAGTTGSIHAHINITGTWTQALRAMHLVESLPYGESINNVRATPGADANWNVSFDLTAVLVHE